MSTVAMAWDNLRAVRCWTPLREVVRTPLRLGDSLFKLGPRLYAVAVENDTRSQRSEDGPFITGVIWAETDGAAKRAKLMEIEADEKQESATPPAGLFPGEVRTYGEIVATLRQGGSDLQEYAEYRVATDGAFVHRTVDAPPFAYFFRQLGHDDSDSCYAVQYTLAD